MKISRTTYTIIFLGVGSVTPGTPPLGTGLATGYECGYTYIHKSRRLVNIWTPLSIPEALLGSQKNQHNLSSISFDGNVSALFRDPPYGRSKVSTHQTHGYVYVIWI